MGTILSPAFTTGLIFPQYFPTDFIYCPNYMFQSREKSPRIYFYVFYYLFSMNIFILFLVLWWFSNAIFSLSLLKVKNIPFDSYARRYSDHSSLCKCVHCIIIGSRYLLILVGNIVKINIRYLQSTIYISEVRYSLCCVVIKHLCSK